MQRILFMTGSMNQTLQMHSIAAQLPDADCWFSQLFSDSPLLNYFLNHTSVLNSTILSRKFRQQAETYLRQQGAQIDYGAKLHKYDLIVYCSDMIVPNRLKQYKSVWVQEGMIDRYTFKSELVKRAGLPAYWCGDTSLNGSSNKCDIYCVASAGYQQFFAARGTRASKMVVTGMPNYDNLEQYRNNDFPHHNYVMVATTDMRETYRYENRPAFITHATRIADGRQMLFKLHPNENKERAITEIEKYAPAGTLIYSSGNTNHMIANCCELITQYSTVVYTGIALGKKVHSWFDVDELERLMPVQNGGESAAHIAHVCRCYLNHQGDKTTFNPQEIAPLPETVIQLNEVC